MTRLVKFTGINPRVEYRLHAEEAARLAQQQARQAAAQPGANVVLFDDLERPIPTPAELAAQTPTQTAPDHDVEMTDAHSAAAEEPLNFPIFINPALIREFYARRQNKPGTRIVFLNGSAQLVTATFDEVAAALQRVDAI